MTLRPVYYKSRVTRPPFDPELERHLPHLQAAKVRASDETLDELRALAIQNPGDLTAGGAVIREDREVPGPAGEPAVSLMVLRPAVQPATKPAGLYYIHGGGMISGDRTTDVKHFLPYVAEGLAVLVSVDYRLAPENPDPAPVQDCYTGLAWMADHADDLGFDPENLIISGTSAGGGLAAGTALMARDRNLPALSHQILICPMLDDREETPSSQMLDGEGIWDRNDNEYGWTALLGEHRKGQASAYAAPSRAADLSGLPRTYLDCGSAEIFRDEILEYASRLSAAGVSVDLHMWGGAFHVFDTEVPQARISKASLAVRDEFIRRALQPET